MTKTYAVIGDPIDNSLSPNIHNAAFKKLGLDCTYIAYRVPKGELAAGVESLKKIKISGFNVTIPHKVAMIKFLDTVDENCSIIGATNTVSNDEGKLRGYNTDMEGFLDPIKKRNLPIKDSKVLLIGAGGAARAITAGFAKENATSIGMKSEPSPISTKTINEKSVVYDIVSKPINTDLIQQSKKNGATIIYGYEMLLGQAALAFKIWHGIEAPYETMKKSILGMF